MQLKVIAYAHNGHTDKFGIPRQSRDESPILTHIVFEPEYSVQEALRGIEGYSHLWLLWGFSENRVQNTDRCTDRIQTDNEWSPTVRPPRLGGNKRMGVFATRSPFRPNPLGLSSVKLVEVQRVQNTDRDADRGQTQKYQLELIVSGADVLDGTPIYDIKPYLSFSDSHEDAKNGFAEETKDYRLEVDWGKAEWCDVGMTSAESPTNHQQITNESLTNNQRITRESPDNHPSITRESPARMSEKDRLKRDIDGLKNDLDELKRDLEFILSQDPRPAYQDDPSREYKLDYAGYTVTFIVQEKRVVVKNIEKM